MTEVEVETETFSEFLKSLTQSKDSINKVTKFAITNAHLAEQLLDAILKRMKKLPTKRRITLFYLIDSICQNASAKKVGEEWLEAVSNNINSLVLELLQEKEPEERESAIQAMRKVFLIWKERKIIATENVETAISSLEQENSKEVNDDAVLDFFEFEEAQKKKSKKSKEPEPIKKSRRRYQDVYASPSEADEEKLRVMEEYRRESKRIRWEQRLRPENDAYFSEFDEWWNLIGEREVRKYIHDYDYKAPLLKSSLISSPFEEHYFKQTMGLLSPYMINGSSPSFSSPSPFPLTPSPSTPYSPTKNRITPDSIVSLSPPRYVQRTSLPSSEYISSQEYYQKQSFNEERREKVDKFDHVDKWNRREKVGNGRSQSYKYERSQNRIQRRSHSRERKRSRSRESRDYRYSRRDRSRSRERNGRSRSSSRDRRRSRSRSVDSTSSLDSRDSSREIRRRESSRTITEISKDKFEEQPSEKFSLKFPTNRYEPEAASDEEIYSSRPSKFEHKSPAKRVPTPDRIFPLKKRKETYSPTSPSSSPERERESKKEISREKERGYKKYPENFKVFIWNLDESLLIFNSSVKETLKMRVKETLSPMSSKLFNLTQDMLSNYMYYKQIQEFEPATMEEMTQYDDKKDLSDYNFQKDGLKSRNPNSDDKRKASYRFRKIRELYESRKFTSKHEAEILIRDMDKSSKGWLSTGRSIIRELSERSDTVNIVYSSSQVVEILAKLILCRLSDFISAQNVYSTAIMAKRELFQQIKDKYPNAKYVVFGDGLGDEEATKEESIPFHKISSLEELQRIQSEIQFDIESVFSPKSQSSSGSKNRNSDGLGIGYSKSRSVVS